MSNIFSKNKIHKSLGSKRIMWGIALILFVPIWIYFIVPNILEIPHDLSKTLEVDSFDNFYDVDNGQYKGEQQSHTKFSYRVIREDDGDLLISNRFDVKTLTGKEVFSVERKYGVNAHSRQHVAGFGDKDRVGYLFAPRMVGLTAEVSDKSPFDYWHVNYDVPAHMEFRDQEIIYGVPVYHYQANFTADQTNELTGKLDRIGQDLGIVLDVRLELWIEPVSGSIIQYSDHAESFYFDLKNGERLYPWNKFHNHTSSETASELASEALSMKQKISFLEFVVPIFLVIISVLILSSSTIYGLIKKNLDKIHDQKRKALIIPVATGLVIVIFSLVISVVAFNITKKQIQLDFYSEIDKINDSIVGRFDLYQNMLKGGKGLFDASDYVSRNDWKAYADSIDFQNTYPGIQGFGFVREVKNDELDSLVSVVRQEGFPDFGVIPSGERLSYAPVIYIEPFDVRNRRAFGYDLLSEATRRSALNYSKNSGEIALSGKVVLVQEDSGEQKQAGFLMFAPVYKSNYPLTNSDERRMAIYGYTYASFRASNFMVGLFAHKGTELGIEIFDGHQLENLDEERLIYKSDLVPDKPEYSVVSTMDIYNNTWTIRYTASKEFGYEPFKNSIPFIIFFSGLILAILISFFVFIINTRRAWAALLASDITKKLWHEKAKSEAILSGVGDALIVTDLKGDISMVNLAFEDLTGLARGEVIGKNIYKIIPIYDEKGGTISSEARPIYQAIRDGKIASGGQGRERPIYIKRKDGKLIQVVLTASVVNLSGENVAAIEILRVLKI